MQEVGSALCVGGGEDGALVIAQNFQPAADIGGMILAIFEGDPKISAEKCCAKLSDKLFAGIAGIAERLAPEVTIQALLVTRPVRAFMREGGKSPPEMGETFSDGSI